MTWLDLAREYFPDANDDELDSLLWNCTAFPVAGVDTIRNQLQHLKDNPGFDPYAETERQMAEFKKGTKS